MNHWKDVKLLRSPPMRFIPVLSLTLLVGLLTAPIPMCRVRFSRSGTLFLAAYTPYGFALAADGASLAPDGKVRQAQKMFQVGKSGAIAFVGYPTVQDSGDRKEEVDAVAIGTKWAAAHPDADIRIANTEINSIIASSWTRFFATRDPGEAAGQMRLRVICIGLADGAPVAIRTKYFVPEGSGKSTRTEVLASMEPARPDLPWILELGKWKTAEELTAGKSPAFRSFKSEPPMQKFRLSRGNGLSLQDFVRTFDVILRATESEEGKQFDTDPAVVGPPNRFALIEPVKGFSWTSPR